MDRPFSTHFPARNEYPPPLHPLSCRVLCLLRSRAAVFSQSVHRCYSTPMAGLHCVHGPATCVCSCRLLAGYLKGSRWAFPLHLFLYYLLSVSITAITGMVCVASTFITPIWLIDELLLGGRTNITLMKISILYFYYYLHQHYIYSYYRYYILLHFFFFFTSMYWWVTVLLEC